MESGPPSRRGHGIKKDRGYTQEPRKKIRTSPLSRLLAVEKSSSTPLGYPANGSVAPAQPMGEVCRAKLIVVIAIVQGE